MCNNMYMTCYVCVCSEKIVPQSKEYAGFYSEPEGGIRSCIDRME